MQEKSKSFFHGISYERMTAGKKKTRIVRIGKVPLNMPNKFRSTGYKPPRTPTLSRSLPFFSGDPSMVKSVEERDKQIDAVRRMQKYNAKIYSKKEQTLRAIHKLRKEQQEKQWKKKVIQYLSEQDWRDGIPDYVPLKLRMMAQKLIDERNAKKRAEAAAEAKKRNKENQQQGVAPPADNGLSTEEEALVTEVSPQGKEQKKRVYTNQDADPFNIERRRKEKEKKEKEKKNKTDEDEDEDEEERLEETEAPDFESASGWDARNGMFSESGYGIMFPRIKRIHNLVHVSEPGNLYSYLLTQTPEQREKVVADWRRAHRDDYAKLQKSVRGVEPPQKMIERAFPKWAVPYDVL